VTSEVVDSVVAADSEARDNAVAGTPPITVAAAVVTEASATGTPAAGQVVADGQVAWTVPLSAVAESTGGSGTDRSVLVNAALGGGAVRLIALMAIGLGLTIAATRLAALAVLEAFAIDAVAGPTVAVARFRVPMVTFFRFTMDDVALLLNTAVATGVALAGADMVPMTSAEDMAATTPAAVQRRWFTDILKSPLCWERERARRR